MVEHLSAPPVLSTPASHILNDTEDVHPVTDVLSDEQICVRYEIQRTIAEIRQQRWRRVALQFPDEMLSHSARVYQLLARGLKPPDVPNGPKTSEGVPANEINGLADLSLTDKDLEPVKLTILADTSYGSCCVDEIAAEHVDADAIIHYGRACLSPTARLPALHIFTRRDLDHEAALSAFQKAFPDHAIRVIITADVPYESHVASLAASLGSRGYTAIFAASIQHDPSSSIPNRTVPASVASDPSSLSSWHIFHISDPPTSLLLTLTSSVASIFVYPTNREAMVSDSSAALQRSTGLLLRRRYALITSLATVSVWGILINTLSVKNYLSMVEYVKQQIANAGKKSYLFVVGKINAAKVANFSEIGGWVVIGCWESSLIDSKDFYKPIITPFELDLALQPDTGRIWTGRWRADFSSVMQAAEDNEAMIEAVETEHPVEANTGSEDESEPPEFDLRTGRYVARTRPMGQPKGVLTNGNDTAPTPTQALTKRSNGEVVSVNGIASPAADFLTRNRTWRGLEIKYDRDEDDHGGLLEEGSTGIAAGYSLGDSAKI
ncbi:Diphthamide biosynthesis protein 2 [Cyphellophora attinorum]|uniref:2-(3-amino-3-carboxypropyl)histidine synthase subunit 2 n=1 Tax=Cyphellophora attinorum TaxID=1664694 RepID=A0A0N0NLV6_9EURO|nr:Diphthamide biosynthesis protein 2 [Phialophora attinorum]KPI39741.1 Diphthamide biosynthesis protein 2 [Phialophora attinorum]